MRLIFVRHGEPNYQKDCLTENGVRQAEDTAERLRSEDIRAIYASPMGRAQETASYTAKLHNLEIRTLDFMHEIDWGNVREDQEIPVPHEGHPWTLGYLLLTESPEYVGSDHWDQHPYFRDNRCLACYRTVAERFDAFLAEFGLVRRNGLYECVRENHDTIALFAHGGSGAVMFSHVLNLPFPFVLTSMPYGVCSVSVLNFDELPGKKVTPRLELFNDMRHLSSFRTEPLHFEK